MERITVIKDNLPHFGLFTRNTVQGKEYDMIQEFISFYSHQFLRSNKKNNLAIFIEPRVASGFPDVVFASYSPSITDNWSDQRSDINTDDLKVLSHLILAGQSTRERLIAQLGLTKGQAGKSLNKLLNANLITYKNKTWKPKKLNSIFNIKKLVSLEAKINDTSRVIEQSFTNTWFASHSYALTRAESPRDKTLLTFSGLGLGLYCRSQRSHSFREVVEPAPLPLPSSYQSLLFNEWIGNMLTSK